METLIIQLESVVTLTPLVSDFQEVCSGVTELSLALSQMSPEQLRGGQGCQVISKMRGALERHMENVIRNVVQEKLPRQADD